MVIIFLLGVRKLDVFVIEDLLVLLPFGGPTCDAAVRRCTYKQPPVETKDFSFSVCTLELTFWGALVVVAATARDWAYS